MSTLQAAPGPVPTAASAVAPAASLDPSDPVLTRLKQLEEERATFSSTDEKYRKEMEEKDRLIAELQGKNKELSEETSKEMKDFLKDDFEKYMEKLKERLSPETIESIKRGMLQLAEDADKKSPMWEMMCEASAVHKTSVLEIERLVQQDADNKRAIEDLRGFKSEASRICTSAAAVPPSASYMGAGVKRASEAQLGGDAGRNVRSRASNEAPPEAAKDAWAEFSRMCSRDLASGYSTLVMR